MLRNDHRRGARPGLVLLAALFCGAFWSPFGIPSKDSPGFGGASAFDPQDGNTDPILSDRGEGPNHQLEREAWFYGQRAYPAQAIPQNARFNAWTFAKTRITDLLQVRASQRVERGIAVSPWRLIGPAPIDSKSSGRVSAIAVDPKDSRVVYIGGAQGGIWKTTDGGMSWKPMTDNQPSLAVGAIAIDPVNTNIVYVGTGEPNFSFDSYYGAGILRTTDGGSTWTQLGIDTFARNAISKLIIEPSTAGSNGTTTIYASAARAASNFTRIDGPPRGIFVSRDSGRTWKLLLPGIATDLVMDPSSPSTLYAAIAGEEKEAGIFKTQDQGLTWTPLRGALPAGGFGRISLTLAPSSPQSLLASYEDRRDGSASNLLGIFKSTDGGRSWQQTSSPTVSCQCFYDNLIAFDPDDSQIVYWGGVGLYKSLNGGQSWQSILQGIHVDQHAIAFGPAAGSAIGSRTLWAGNDGGVWKSENGGGSWTSANNGLALTQFIGVASHPTNPSIAYGGTQDNGTLKYEGSLIWRTVLPCDGGHAAVDYANPSSIIATTQSNGCFRIALLLFDGGFFLPWAAGINVAGNGSPDGRALFYAPLEISPFDSKTLFYASYRVYISTNGGLYWSPISPDLTRGPNSGALRPVVSAIGPGPMSSIYAGTGDGKVQATFDGGGEWRDLTKPPLPNRFVTGVAVDPASPQVAYVTFSGFNDSTPTTPGHVFRTTNGGASWVDVSGNLPDVPIDTIVVDPRSNTNARAVFVGTDIGVFVSAMGGGQWLALSDGLPNVAVFELDLNARTDILRAATHGRSMFDLNNVSQIYSAAQKTSRVVRP